MLHSPIVSSSSKRPASLAAVVVVAAAMVPAAARAAVEWHPDLATAHAASAISHRPVLAVFVASWGSDCDSFEKTCLVGPEAEAVLAACFEPVRVDVDRHPALTRAVGVKHVPAACVLDADDALLAAFDMPGSPEEFVAAATNASLRAAFVGHKPPAARELGPAPASGPVLPGPAPVAAPAAATAGLEQARRPRRGSMARLAAKVGELSAFAGGRDDSGSTIGPAMLDGADRAAADRQSAVSLVAWPGEDAGWSPSTGVGQPTQPAAPATIAPWLQTAPTVPAPTPFQPSTPAPQPAQAPAAVQAQAPVAPPQQQPLTAAPAVPLPATTPPQAAKPATPQSAFISAFQKPFSLFTKQTPPQPAAPATAATPPALPGPPAATAERDPAGSMPLGLEGYCPVTLVDRGTWVEGRAQWGARHRGRTYLFAGPEQQRAFLADPDRYAPALSGDDPVLALDRGSSTPGQRRYGVTYQSRMYLFATPETRAAFAADPARYAPRIAIAERTPAGGGRLY